jgi:hypothetical protein
MQVDNFERLISDVVRCLEEAQSASHSAENRIEQLCDKISGAIFRLREGLPGCGLNRSSGMSASIEELLKRLARPVGTLTITRGLKSHKDTAVTIEDDKFFLPHKLAETLTLATSGKADDCGIPSYRGLAEVAAELGITKHALNTRIYRLRKILFGHGWNPFLLDTSNSQFRFLAKKVVIAPRVL